MSVSPTPSDSELETALRALVASDLTLRERARSRFSSTFETERVSAITESGSLDLLCKYGSGYRDRLTGHRRGIDYEASIYEHFLPDRRLRTPRYHGSFKTVGSAQCLVLGFVDGSRQPLAIPSRCPLDLHRPRPFSRSRASNDPCAAQCLRSSVLHTMGRASAFTRQKWRPDPTDNRETR